MSAHRTPEDEPFDHEALLRHSRTSSSANLLQSESSTVHDPYYDNDNDNVDAFKETNHPKVEEYDPTGMRASRNYQDFGEYRLLAMPSDTTNCIFSCT